MSPPPLERDKALGGVPEVHRDSGVVQRAVCGELALPLAQNVLHHTAIPGQVADLQTRANFEPRSRHQAAHSAVHTRPRPPHLRKVQQPNAALHKRQPCGRVGHQPPTTRHPCWHAYHRLFPAVHRLQPHHQACGSNSRDECAAPCCMPLAPPGAPAGRSSADSEHWSGASGAVAK